MFLSSGLGVRSVAGPYSHFIQWRQLGVQKQTPFILTDGEIEDGSEDTDAREVTGTCWHHRDTAVQMDPICTTTGSYSLARISSTADICLILFQYTRPHLSCISTMQLSNFEKRIQVDTLFTSSIPVPSLQLLW